MSTSEPLRESLGHYLLFRRLTAKSAYQVRHSLELFELHLGREATVGDLRSDTINRWLVAEEKRYSQRTLAGHRANVLTIWRDCADRGIADLPRRVRRVGKPKPKPKAWDVGEVRLLLSAAGGLPGHLENGISRAFYFETFLQLAWQTGLRRGDIFALSKADIRTDCIYVRQSKTQHVSTWKITPELSATLRSMPGDKPLSWPQSEWMFDYYFRVLKTAAGITTGKHAHSLRASAATNLALRGVGPHQIQVFLGHANLQSQDNYVDKSLIYQTIPAPDALESEVAS